MICPPVMMAMDPPEGTREPTAMVWSAPMVSVAPPETVTEAVFVVPVPASAPLIVPGKVQEEEIVRFPLGVTAQSTASADKGRSNPTNNTNTPILQYIPIRK